MQDRAGQTPSRLVLLIEDVDKTDQFRCLPETRDEVFLVALVIILDEIANDVRRFGNNRGIEALIFAGGPNSGKGCRVVTDVNLRMPHAAGSSREAWSTAGADGRPRQAGAN